MNYLKKAKANRNVPISLSSRRYSLNSELCLTPLKLDLSPNPHENAGANLQSNPSEPVLREDEQENFLLT